MMDRHDVAHLLHLVYEYGLNRAVLSTIVGEGADLLRNREPWVKKCEEGYDAIRIELERLAAPKPAVVVETNVRELPITADNVLKALCVIENGWATPGGKLVHDEARELVRRVAAETFLGEVVEPVSA